MTQVDTQPLLRVRGVSRRFRGLMALTDYDLELRAGEILGVIGPNGAGKTTLFNVMTGFLRPTTGRIEMLGQDITRLRPDQVARCGIARTFQTIRLFGKLSVLDNVKIAQQLHLKTGFLETLFSSPSFYRKEGELERRAMQHLAELGRPTSRTTRLPRCRTAASARSRSPAPWPWSPESCCWTSPPRA